MTKKIPRYTRHKCEKFHVFLAFYLDKSSHTPLDCPFFYRLNRILVGQKRKDTAIQPLFLPLEFHFSWTKAPIPRYTALFLTETGHKKAMNI